MSRNKKKSKNTIKINLESNLQHFHSGQSKQIKLSFSYDIIYSATKCRSSQTEVKQKPTC